VQQTVDRGVQLHLGSNLCEFTSASIAFIKVTDWWIRITVNEHDIVIGRRTKSLNKNQIAHYMVNAIRSAALPMY
jgi:hypothetical protein